MINNADVIDTLNDLIEISKDGEEGFRHSAENATDPRLKEFFLSRSAGVAASVKELQDLVRSLGGSPVDSASLSGTLHRRWIDLKTALTLNDNLAVLNETERGEDIALSAYDNALALDLPPDVEIVVSRQYEDAKRNHDSVRQLREVFEAEVTAH